MTRPVSVPPVAWALRGSFVVLLAGALWGFALWQRSDPLRFMASPPGISIELFLRQDLLWLFVAAAMVWLAVVLGRRMDVESLPATPPRRAVLAVALVFTGAAALGVHFVYHEFSLSLDEFLACFQGRGIAAGYIFPRLPDEWRTWGPALQPIFMRYNNEFGFWRPTYLPGNALMLALFDLVGLMPWTHVVTGGLCVWATARLAMRAWPELRWMPALAAGLLATSPQMLITATTSYSMTPHLLATLLWVELFERRDWKGHVGAILLAFVATGLHRPNIHPVVALPFVLSLVRDRSWRTFALYGVAYTLICGFWIVWSDVIERLAFGPPAAAQATSEAVHFVRRIKLAFADHSALDLIYLPTNILRFITWQNLVMLPLMGLGLWSIRSAPRLVRLGAWATGLLLFQYVLAVPWQGHGWGYRYLHPVLGFCVLIALHGALATWRQASAAHRGALIALGALGTLALPARWAQTEAFVGPFAAASDLIRQRTSEVVIVDDRDIWFGVDLVRNDPLLRERPIVLSGAALAVRDMAWLCRQYDVSVVDYADVESLGMWRHPLSDRATRIKYIMSRLGCPRRR